MLKILEIVTMDALSHNNPSKTRDCLYFKKYLLNSTIWHQTLTNYIKTTSNNDNDQKNNDNNNNSDITNNQTTIYNVILETIQKPLNDNKQFAFEHLSYSGDWHSLQDCKITKLGDSDVEDEEKKKKKTLVTLN